ncbi:MAG: prephenate dehydratase [Parcubacteria group bacterium Greene0714_21]|nr:MAG: prephenate dehydratase [Parcubacteria group bacterium Greene0416_39]TSC97186.1 MAG: prephenate dehydratase [Parcubacteria group bacterium Greene1014_47]TSD04144.1 MAG: prephenate dehydratase [Parcubacteria group bacterium Greene0714_21]
MDSQVGRLGSYPVVMGGRIAYLTPYGTFGSEAAVRYDSTAELVPAQSNEEVLRMVVRREANKGIVPIYNNTEGVVNGVMDEFIFDDRFDHSGTGITIVAELLLPVEQCLIGPNGTVLEQVVSVLSHPQALGQCSKFLDSHCPHAARIATLSTAGAVVEAMKTPYGVVAIASAFAAKTCPGAEVLARDIQDQKNNITRFVVVCRSPSPPPTGDDKTLLCIFPKEKDRPGTLYWILGEFARLGINLTKVMSRPSKRALDDDVFVVELNGHLEDPQVDEAMAGVRRQVEVVKVLGSYPRKAGVG